MRRWQMRATTNANKNAPGSKCVWKNIFPFSWKFAHKSSPKEKKQKLQETVRVEIYIHQGSAKRDPTQALISHHLPSFLSFLTFLHDVKQNFHEDARTQWKVVQRVHPWWGRNPSTDEQQSESFKNVFCCCLLGCDAQLSRGHGMLSTNSQTAGRSLHRRKKGHTQKNRREMRMISAHFSCSQVPPFAHPHAPIKLKFIDTIHCLKPELEALFIPGTYKQVDLFTRNCVRNVKMLYNVQHASERRFGMNVRPITLTASRPNRQFEWPQFASGKVVGGEISLFSSLSCALLLHRNITMSAKKCLRKFSIEFP